MIKRAYMLFEFDDEHETQVSYTFLPEENAWEVTVQTAQIEACGTRLHIEQLFKGQTTNHPCAEGAIEFYNLAYNQKEGGVK